MKTLLLDRVVVGSHPDEVVYFELAKQFHEGQVEISNDTFTIYKGGRVIFSTKIALYEHDHIYKTYRGNWDDGKMFRIIQASDELRPLAEAMHADSLSIGSMFSDGYAVFYKQVDATGGSHYTMLDALKKGSNNPPSGRLIYHSNTHQRYEYEEPVRGEQAGCHRDIIIEKNISGGMGYSVTVNNPDAIPGSWGATTMGTKPMKIISTSANKIEMQGYGYDKTAVMMGVPMSDATYENYGMTIYHNGQSITKCIIHLIERNVDIDYYIK